MVTLFIKMWNKIFGNTIFSIYFDNRKTRHKKKSNKNNKHQTVTSSRKYIPTSNMTVIDLDKETNVLDVNLLDNNINNVDKKIIRQYTKTAVTALLILASLWITFSYIMSAYALIVYGNLESLQELSKEVCITLLGTMLGYFLKSYFETYSQKKNELEIEKNLRLGQIQNTENVSNKTDILNEDESVG